jgi:electron transfer flavoprotein alpha subunit
MKGDILVIAEHWTGAPDGVTLQMLTKGRELADAAGVGLAVLVLGHGLDGIVDVLRDAGMDRIWVLDDPALAEAAGDLQAHAIAAAANVLEPGLILVGYSLVGMELAPAIAVKLGVTAMTNCANVAMEEGAVVVTRPPGRPWWPYSGGLLRPSSLPQGTFRFSPSLSMSPRSLRAARCWR